MRVGHASSPRRQASPRNVEPNDTNPASGAPRRSAISPNSTRPVAASTPPIPSIADAASAENPRSVRYRVCWVVASPPKIGGIVNTRSRSQNGAEPTIARTVELFPTGRGAAWPAAGRSRVGRTTQASGIKAATATTYPARAARQPKRVITHWQGGASP